MTTMNDGPTSGQVTDPSIPTPKSDVSDLIAVLEKNTKAIVRIGAVLTKFGERLDALEARDDEAPVTEEHPASQLGRLALRADGAVMLEVTSDLTEEDIADREVARFVKLTEAEACDVIDRADVGFSDAAARAAWQVARARKGASS